MIKSFLRKARQVADDPVLRLWLVRRLTGKAAKPAAFRPHRPAYLEGMGRAKAAPTGGDGFHALIALPPTGPIDLPLPGLLLKLNPGDEKDVFRRAYDDVETLLALHRFAWVPLVKGSGITASWVQALWDVWRKSHGGADKSWAWHPYTVAERAINLLDLAQKKGLVEPAEETTALLVRHAEVIFDNLEYFGAHNTSNHLANNGRGLYRLGLALGLEWAVEAGAGILRNEAKRIFMGSGILREGSSHYHFLMARNFADAWLAARAHARPEQEELRAIAARALAVIPWLILPGGLPLIGDISPDCPPEYLIGLVGTETGWLAGLGKDDKAALLSLIDDTAPASADDLCADGWLRFTHGPWSGLWHAAPGGFSQAPGHGHQDAGGFELHFDGLPVFVDPGRGSYGETGDAAYYRSGHAHNTVTIDGAEAFPVNKPYYDDAFRREIAGAKPALHGGGDEVILKHSGFQRIGGLGMLTRQWRFIKNTMALTDTLDGQGSRRITRRFYTPLDTEPGAGGVVLRGADKTFHLHSPDATATVAPATLWHAYGGGHSGSVIEFTADASLPWSGDVRLEVL
ncbi:MAG: heparinase II/III family protein [Proteobacteria bacterium]|nr:heparinase II/III family protein [Pseudomonadota bacterium]